MNIDAKIIFKCSKQLNSAVFKKNYEQREFTQRMQRRVIFKKPIKFNIPQ